MHGTLDIPNPTDLPTHSEDTCVWTQQLSHWLWSAVYAHTTVTLHTITPLSLKSSFLTTNASKTQLACLMGLSPPLYRCCMGLCGLGGRGNSLIRTHQELAYHTDIFLLKEEKGAQLCVSLCLFPRGDMKWQNLGGGSCLLAAAFVISTPFVHFSSLKPEITRALQKGTKAFFVLFHPLVEGLSSRNSMSLMATIFEQLAAIFSFFWRTGDAMRQCPHYLISNTGHFRPVPDFLFQLFNLKNCICHPIRLSHLRCLFYKPAIRSDFLGTVKKVPLTVSFHFLSCKSYLCPPFNIICPLWGVVFFINWSLGYHPFSEKHSSALKYFWYISNKISECSPKSRKINWCGLRHRRNGINLSHMTSIFLSQYQLFTGNDILKYNHRNFSIQTYFSYNFPSNPSYLWGFFLEL